MKKKILIVEDSPEYIQIIKAAVESTYEAIVAENGSEALGVLTGGGIDLVLLDIVLPDILGYQICNYIKSTPELRKVPVIFLTGNNQLEEKLQGFDSGGDDYLTKPFHYKELLARISANLRTAPSEGSSVLKIEDLNIDVSKQLVFNISTDSRVELTRIEFKLLLCFVKHPDWILSRDQILNKVWPDKLSIADRTIDSHISNLRKKLKRSRVCFEAVHGLGYRLKIKAGTKAA